MVFLPSVRVLPGEAVERGVGAEVAEPQRVRASDCESFLPSLTKRYLIEYAKIRKIFGISSFLTKKNFFGVRFQGMSARTGRLGADLQVSAELADEHRKKIF